jgi:oligoribonuclease NrnB/cAMP/cGMP phosphodiesterase (DHH superfamily)
MTICFYHSPCGDGIVSAWLVKQAFPEIEFKGVWAGCKDLKADDYVDTELMFVDLCPNQELLVNLLGNGCKVSIYDHHISSQREIEGIEHPNLEVVFDMSRSGCQIVFDCITATEPGIDRLWFVDYVGDRDLWKFEMPNSKLVTLGLFEFEYLTFEGLDKLPKGPVYDPEVKKFIDEELLSKAQIIHEKHRRIMKYDGKKAIKATMKIGSETYNIWLGSTLPILTSDFGHYLYMRPFPDDQGMPDFAVVWKYDMRRNIWKYSLRGGKRGDEEGIDLSKIASSCGGGGHKAASGFETDVMPNLFFEFS